MGALLAELALALAVVGLVVGLSWRLGGRRDARATPEAASGRLAFDEPDFNARAWFFDRRGRAALAISDTEVAVVVPHGDRLVTRRMRLNRALIAADATRLTVRFDAPGRRTVTLELAGEDEVRRALGRLKLDA